MSEESKYCNSSLHFVILLSLVTDGASQEKEGAYRTRGPVLHEADSTECHVPAQSICYSQGPQTWKPFPE